MRQSATLTQARCESRCLTFKARSSTRCQLQRIGGAIWGPENPALQAHEFLVVLFGGELELSGQTEQGSGPEVALYLPAPHNVHSPPLFPDEPALQWQPVFSSLAAKELESAGHTRHTLEEAFIVDE